MTNAEAQRGILRRIRRLESEPVGPRIDRLEAMLSHPGRTEAGRPAGSMSPPTQVQSSRA